MRTCIWTEMGQSILTRTWETACGRDVDMAGPEAEGYVHCPYCGSHIRENPLPDGSEANERWWRVKIVETRYHYMDVLHHSEGRAVVIVQDRLADGDMRCAFHYADDVEREVSESNLIQQSEVHQP